MPSDKHDRPGLKIGPLNGDPTACKRAHRAARARVEAFLRQSIGPGHRVYIEPRRQWGNQ